LILRFVSWLYNLFLNSGKAEKQRSKKRETQKRREAENQRSGKAKKKRIRRNAKQYTLGGKEAKAKAGRHKIKQKITKPNRLRQKKKQQSGQSPSR